MLASVRPASGTGSVDAEVSEAGSIVYSDEEEEDEQSQQLVEQAPDESFSVDEEEDDCGSIDLDCSAVRAVQEAAKALERPVAAVQLSSQPVVDLCAARPPLSRTSLQEGSVLIPAGCLSSGVVTPCDKLPVDRSSAGGYTPWSYRTVQSATGAACEPAVGSCQAPRSVAAGSGFDRTSAPSITSRGPPSLIVPQPTRLPSISGNQSPSMLPHSSGSQSPMYATKLMPLSSRTSPSVTTHAGFDPAELQGAKKLDIHATAAAARQSIDVLSAAPTPAVQQPYLLSPAGLLPAPTAPGKLPAVTGRTSLAPIRQSVSPERLPPSQARDWQGHQPSPGRLTPERVRNPTPQGRNNRAQLLPSLEAQRVVQAAVVPPPPAVKPRKLTVSESMKGASQADKPSYIQWSFRHRATDHDG